MQRNRLEVVGYLATKPAVRYLPSGTPVANVRLGAELPIPGRRRQTATTHQLAQPVVLRRPFPRRAHLREGRQHLRRGHDRAAPVHAKGTARKRIVHEVVVRNCHLIAAARGAVPAQTEPRRQHHEEPSPSRIFRREQPIMTVGLSARLRDTRASRVRKLGGHRGGRRSREFSSSAVSLGVRFNSSPSLPMGLYITTADAACESG